MKIKNVLSIVLLMLVVCYAIFLIGCDTENLSGGKCSHLWKQATCTSAKTCSLCNETSGESLGHTWRNATCTTPKICSLCFKTEGNAIEHSYTETITIEASCIQDGVKNFVCKYCSEQYSKAYSMKSYTPTEIYNMSVSSVGEIITYDKSQNELALGTGFVYSIDGKIVTNYHVIEDAYSAKITINGTEYVVQKILAYDKEMDLAVLKINATELTPLAICKKEHLTGGAVYAFGSSKGLTATFSQGIITHAKRDMDGVTCVQHDAAISSGNSGGPLINQYGEVIGINTWTIRDSQNLNFAISTLELDKLSYATPLTFSEFYEKECDVFLKLKNYIISNGTYDSADGEYVLTLGRSYSSDYTTTYTRKARYEVSTDEISLQLFIDADYMVTITIDEVDGNYRWDYYDYCSYYMYGTIYASTYTNNTLLGYSYNNISYSSIRNSVRELASSMVSVLCLYMDKDYASIGVTAEDLGFLYY